MLDKIKALLYILTLIAVYAICVWGLMITWNQWLDGWTLLKFVTSAMFAIPVTIFVMAHLGDRVFKI